MRIGLINPAQSIFVEEAVSPVGLATLAACAMRAGHEAEILDISVSSDQEVSSFFRRDFHVIGLSVVSATFLDAVALLPRIHARWPGVPIVLGGPHVSIADETVFETEGIDFAVRGEGEETLVDLLHHLGTGNQNYSDIPGLSFRTPSGAVQVNPPRAWNTSLNDLPFPCYDSVNLDRYVYYTIVASRGCPYGCTFCAVQHVGGRKIRLRSPENVLGEIEHLYSRYGRKEIIFSDDVFNLDVARARRFCQVLIDSGLNLRWQCWSFRADHADPELLETMKVAGCQSVSVGVESADPTVLKNIRKRETIEEIEQGIRNILRSGITCYTLNMIGNQGDTLDTVKRTISFNKRLRVDGAKFFLALPYPKTELWDYVQKHGRFLQLDYQRFHHFSREPVFETDDFLRQDRLTASYLANRGARAIDARARLRSVFRKLVKGQLFQMSPARLLRSARLTLKTLKRAVWSRS